ncbi:hypothetical protein Tco_0339147 [Tanacetum coccineum]
MFNCFRIINAKMKYSDPPLDFWWNASSSRGLVRLLVLDTLYLLCVTNGGSVYAHMKSGSGNGDSEVQRTMLELLNQLDGFEASNKIKGKNVDSLIRYFGEDLVRCPYEQALSVCSIFIELYKFSHFDPSDVTKMGMTDDLEASLQVLHGLYEYLHALSEVNPHAAEISMTCRLRIYNYDKVVARIAQHLNLDDPSKIRLTSHNWCIKKPKREPIKYLTRCEVYDSSTLAFWSKSSVDIEPRRIRLQSNSYTTNTLLDTITAATFQSKLWYITMSKISILHWLVSVKSTNATSPSTYFLLGRSFFEKEKLYGPNFIDWYRNLRIAISAKDKLTYLEHHIPAAPGQQLLLYALVAHNRWLKASKEIACLMLELKTMFSQQAEQELLQTLRAFHACKQEEGQSVSSYVLKIKSYKDNLERLGHLVSLNFAVSLTLIFVSKEYNGFVQNYNMHDTGKTINELHAMLKLHEQMLPKKDDAHVLHAIRASRIQKITTRTRNRKRLLRVIYDAI